MCSAKSLCVWVVGVFLLRAAMSGQTTAPRTSRIGREVALSHRLADDEEFSILPKNLLEYGKSLFMANWTEEEGGGRPGTKGTGAALSDPSKPLVGDRSFNRIS